MDADRVACWCLALWLVGMPVTFGYFYKQCGPGTKELVPCVATASLLWPLALPGNISYRVFN